MPRRVLFITYYFPPSGGPGVQRALKFAKYLPDFGWQPTVLTVRPEDAAYPDLDPSLIGEVEPGLAVVRTRAWDPYALYARLLGQSKGETVGVGFLGDAGVTWRQRVARWLRANVFLPDARAGWVPFAVRRGRSLLASTPHDAILTTGPPHSAHLVGLALGRYGLPWVADLRDPWTGIDFYDALPMTAWARAFDGALERTVLRRASAVTVISPSMRTALARRAAAPYEVIQNGYDPEDFEREAPALAEDFQLTYVGNMNEARNPLALWQALQRLQAPERMSRLRVRLVGNVDPAVMASARAYGMAGLVDVHPYVPHPEAVHAMQSSALLLLVINRVAGAEGITTGKLYEYVASSRPVLGIGPPAGDAAHVLEEASAGRLFDYEDVAGVARALRGHYEAWMSGTPMRGASAADASRYSRKGQTGTLAALLDRLLINQQ